MKKSIVNLDNTYGTANFLIIVGIALIVAWSYVCIGLYDKYKITQPQRANKAKTVKIDTIYKFKYDSLLKDCNLRQIQNDQNFNDYLRLQEKYDNLYSDLHKIVTDVMKTQPIKRRIKGKNRIFSEDMNKYRPVKLARREL